MGHSGVQDKPQADVEMGFVVGAQGCSNKPGWGMQDELGGVDGAWRCRMVLGVWGAPIAWAQQCRGDSGAGTGVRVGSSIPGLAVGSVGATVTPVSVGWRRFDIPPPPRHALRGIIAPGSSPAEGKPEPPVLPGPKPGGWRGCSALPGGDLGTAQPPVQGAGTPEAPWPCGETQGSHSPHPKPSSAPGLAAPPAWRVLGLPKGLDGVDRQLSRRGDAAGSPAVRQGCSGDPEVQRGQTPSVAWMSSLWCWHQPCRGRAGLRC